MNDLNITKIIDNSIIPNFKDHCIEVLGETKGAQIVQDTYDSLPVLINKTGSQDSQMMEQHLLKNLLPTLSYYQSLLKNKISNDEALRIVTDELQIHAENEQEAHKKLTGLPFCFQAFKSITKKKLSKNYSEQGWKIKWTANNEREFAFTIHRCLYKEILDLHNSGELLSAFCQVESTKFNGLLPKIEFARTITLATGTCCDFRFVKRN